jgi:glutathione peroxidase
MTNYQHMKPLLLFCLAIAACLPSRAQSSFYAIPLDSLGGQQTIALSAYGGKKILIVNAASADSASGQYAQLKQLHNLYKDSLVVIVVPSNSFGTEGAGEAALAAFYAQEGGNRFPVTEKMAVKGGNIAPLYQWLTQKAKNGVMDADVKRPFQKYLVSETGKLIGVFSGKISPLDAPIIRAITNAR